MNSYGIYTITHIPTGVVYVGQTQASKLSDINNRLYGCLPARFAQHISALDRGDHYNAGLQSTWNGLITDYRFDVIERLENVDLKTALEAERKWIKAFPAVFNQRNRTSVPKVKTYDTATRERVIELLRAGLSGKRIAELTGVSTGTVSLIRQAAGIASNKRPRVRCLWKRFAVAMQNPVMTKNGNRVHLTATLEQNGLDPELCRSLGHWIQIGMPTNQELQ